ncbi:MAG: hypothetical protein J7M12_04610, partial [Candidatus Hydrogenedentes bacterium]|nr:hypothetical protein [Candidatus Hydrogenedentota bacterium]
MRDVAYFARNDKNRHPERLICHPERLICHPERQRRISAFSLAPRTFADPSLTLRMTDQTLRMTDQTFRMAVFVIPCKIRDI